MSKLTANATPLNAAEIAALLEKEGGHASRKVIVVTHDGVPYRSVFFADEKIVPGSIQALLQEEFGTSAVYYLVDLYLVGYVTITEKRLAMRTRDV